MLLPLPICSTHSHINNYNRRTWDQKQNMLKLTTYFGIAIYTIQDHNIDFKPLITGSRFFHNKYNRMGVGQYIKCISISSSSYIFINFTHIVIYNYNIGFQLTKCF